MTGFEYQAASHMIQEGLLLEGLSIVKAIRDRYDGEKRNPWNEIECGSNYARSMASYSLLLAYSGFMYDMTARMIGFDPVLQEDLKALEGYRFFWSLECGWGMYIQKEQTAELSISYGQLEVSTLKLPKFANVAVRIQYPNGWQENIVADAFGYIRLGESVVLRRGEHVIVSKSASSAQSTGDRDCPR
jgi:hypothetical protein